MSTINKIAIKNSLGEYDESKIGAQAEDVIISRDENGKIIENIEIPGVTISSTEGIATTVKEIDERVATDSSIGQIQVGSGFNIDANGILTPAFGNTTGSICEGNDPRLAGIGTVTNNLTLSSNGDGDAAGTTFNGGAAVKISYNSIGAAPNQKATTSQWGQIKIKSNSGLGIDSTNGLSLSSHASASNIYGVGTNANYGHLKIVDATSSTSGTSYNAAAGVAASASSVANVISQISKSWKKVIDTNNEYISAGEIWYEKFGNVVTVQGMFLLSRNIPASTLISAGFPKPLSHNVPILVLSTNPYNHIMTIDGNGNLYNSNIADFGGANEIWWNVNSTYICE